MKKISRCTLDLDSRSLFRLCWAILIFWIRGFRREITIKPSPSKRGYHLIMWKKQGVSLHKLITIRRLAGGDKTRCDLDEWGSGQRMINVLFTGKKRKKLKKGDVVFDEQDMQVETCGCEDNIKISFGET